MSDQGFTFETPRLLLREFRAADAPALFELNSDPDVLRYTGEAPFANLESVETYIREYPDYRINGFGRWAVEGRDSGAFMGFCGLCRRETRGDVDVAFRLFPQYWASGYATEAARGSLEAGFRVFALDDILGFAMRENLPSITVLQKLGMNFRHMAEEDGVFWLVYGIEREAFLAKG